MFLWLEIHIRNLTLVYIHLPTLTLVSFTNFNVISSKVVVSKNMLNEDLLYLLFDIALWQRHSQARSPAFLRQVAPLRKLTCRKVSRGAWNRKWKGNRFVMRSGNPSQISLFPAVWFCSSYLITFLICKPCIIPALVPVRLIRITYLKCLLH